jgi:transketolase
MDRSVLVPALTNLATRLRIDSVRSTSEAGSGHPTSCASAADILAALFFAELRFDPKDPHHPGSDRFILSKGHAAPILYSAWAEAGAFDRSELLKLREIGSTSKGTRRRACRLSTWRPVRSARAYAQPSAAR